MAADNGIDDFIAGEICRVGGMALTQRAIEFCAFVPGARLCDIGCGKGATVHYLRAAGFDAKGLDSDAKAIAQAGPHCQTGDALLLPYEEGSMDGLFFECSLSQMSEPGQILREARRVLRPSGKLIVSDLYARNEESGGFLMNHAQWIKLYAQADFHPLLFEDRSDDLKALNAQLIWQYSGKNMEKIYGRKYDVSAFKSARCGYFLLIAGMEK